MSPPDSSNAVSDQPNIAPAMLSAPFTVPLFAFPLTSVSVPVSGPSRWKYIDGRSAMTTPEYGLGVGVAMGVGVAVGTGVGVGVGTGVAVGVGEGVGVVTTVAVV